MKSSLTLKKGCGSNLKKESRLLLILSFCWAGLILALGAWWAYLILKFGGKIELIAGEDGPNLVRLIKWEGSAFVILIFALSGSILFLFNKDQKKSRSIQAFFASMTHELKTPLASVRLQAEVIYDLINDNAKKEENERLTKLSERLIEDTQKLETQMDKILQLARVERGGELNLTSFDLEEFIKKVHKNWAKELVINIDSSKLDSHVLADEFALELVFRNLFENTRLHSKSNTVDIRLQENNDIKISYDDHGVFEGDFSKLGSLFYKHKSTKGSGIGLYLSHRLLTKMSGDFLVNGPKSLTFVMTLQKQGEEHV